jgi:hypothetical protein
MKKIALIIGNGKSATPLVEDNFKSIPKNVDTYGTSIAFRYYEKINWWPTYYGLFDPKVVNHHKEKFQEFLLDENNPVKTWFLCDNWCKGYFQDPYKKLQIVPHNVTGPGTTNEAVKKKYDEIWLIGMDNQYIWNREYVKRIGFERNDNRAEFIVDLEDNPNYAFPHYQIKGDVFSFNWNSKDGEIPKGNIRPWEQLFDKKNIFDYCEYNNLKFKKRNDIIGDLKNLDN